MYFKALMKLVYKDSLLTPYSRWAIAQGDGATLISAGNELLASWSWVQASSITASSFVTVEALPRIGGGFLSSSSYPTYLLYLNLN